MSELKKQIEDLFLVENEIYTSLKIEAHYLAYHHNETENEFKTYDPTLIATVKRLKELIDKSVLGNNFEHDPLASLKIKTFIELAHKFLTTEIEKSKKMHLLERWFIDCEARLDMVEVQRDYIANLINKIEN